MPAPPGRRPFLSQVRKEGFAWSRQGIDTVEAAEAHPRVLADPEPYVRFAEFQNSALLFRLTFFLSQEELVRSGRILEDARSDLRFALAESLPAAGIDIVPGGLMDVRFPEGDPFSKGKDGASR